MKNRYISLFSLFLPCSTSAVNSSTVFVSSVVSFASTENAYSSIVLGFYTVGRSISFFFDELCGVLDFIPTGDCDNEFLLDPLTDLMFMFLGRVAFVEKSGRCWIFSRYPNTFSISSEMLSYLGFISSCLYMSVSFSASSFSRD